MSVACRLVSGAIAAMLLVSEMAGPAAVVQAQAAWTPLRTDTVHDLQIALAAASLVWIDWLGLPAGAALEATIERADGTVPLPREGLFLPAGSHVVQLRAIGSLLPDSVMVRVRSPFVRRTSDSSDSAILVAVDSPVEIRDRVAGPVRLRTSIPSASTVVLAASGAVQDVRWLDTAGSVRAQGSVAHVAGPTELMVELNGSLETGATVAIRSFPILDELEPNDFPLLAPDAQLDEWLSISLASPADVDHVAVELAEAGVLQVDWGIVPSGVTPVAELVDEGGLASAITGTVSAGRRIVRIRSSDGTWSPDVITARVRFTAVRDVAGSDSDAMPRLDWTNPATLLLSAPTWSDSLTITLQQRGVLYLFSHTGDPRAQFRMRLRRGDRTIDVESPELGMRLDSGDYVATMSYEGPPTATDHRVQLRASFARETDPNEPNDTPASAPEVRLPSKITVRIDGAGDADWWRIRVPQPGILRINRVGSWLVDAPPLVFRLLSLADTTKALEMRQIKDEGLDVRFVVDTGVHLLEVTGDPAAGRDYGLNLRLDRAQELTTAGRLAVALIGIALPEESERYVRYTAINSGTLYLAADDTAGLNAALDSAGAIVLRAPNHTLRNVLIGCAVALLIGVVVTWQRRKTVRQATASETN